MPTLSELVRLRTPQRPGPGPMPDPLLRALDLRVRRRIDGLMSGDFQAVRVGRGSELLQIRQYEPGDDVRDIDWSVTARTTEPHVRVRVAERVLTTWLLFDVSPSMLFGTAERTKADVAEGVALSLAHIATRRGNRLGVMTFGGPKPHILEPSYGRAALFKLLTALRREPSPEFVGATSLKDVLRRSGAVVRGHTAIFVVTDLMGPRDWRGRMLQLTDRHDVSVIEVRDPRERELPNVGDVWMVDPETGTEVSVDTGNTTLRERFSQQVDDQRAGAVAMVRAAGARHISLSTDEDWLRELARFLALARVRG